MKQYTQRDLSHPATLNAIIKKFPYRAFMTRLVSPTTVKHDTYGEMFFADDISNDVIYGFTDEDARNHFIADYANWGARPQCQTA